jgi:hypothetical protein
MKSATLIEENTMNPTQIIENLHRGVCRVVFEKVNGEMREMRCTLAPDRLPESQFLHEGRTHSEEYTRVWDLDENAWRSFRFDSVREFNPPQLLNESF